MKHISIYNSYVKDNKSKREMIVNKLKKNGFFPSRTGDIIVVVGGDGTFLSAIRKRGIENKIFVGINTGNLGFFSEFKVDDVDCLIKVLKSNEYWIEEIPLYEVLIKTKLEEVREYFINDVVVERKESGVLHMGVQINGDKLCNIYGDGVLISTDIGSTGYNSSAGGVISLDTTKNLLLTPLHPLWNRSYHSLMKPVMMSDTNEITIYPNSQKIRSNRVVLDGREVKVRDSKNENSIKYVEVRKTDKKVKILRSNNYDRILNTKAKVLNEEL